MTLATLGLLLVPLQYSFEPGIQIQYDSTITFEGFIPILGGNEGTVVVKMGVDVDGLEPEDGAEVQAANEIVSFSVTFNDAALPLDVSAVQEYFPRTTIKLSKRGKIVSSNAPDVQLPVRLPGLDVKRFPDITYVPVQFPKGGAKIGDEWKYSKPFGESDIHYICKLVEEKDGVVKISVSIKQEYELLEDAALEVVKDEADAERRVKTVMMGRGYVLFDTKRGIVTEVNMGNNAVSEVKSLVDGEESQRTLTTTAVMKLRKPELVAERERVWYEKAWDSVVLKANEAISSASDIWATFRLAFQLMVERSSTNGG